MDEDLLSLSLINIRAKFHSTAKEILLNKAIVSPWEEVKVLVPQRGDKKALIDLSLRNSKYMRQEKLKTLNIIDPERHSKRILEQLQKDLRLSELPVQIECFDNSTYKEPTLHRPVWCLKMPNQVKKTTAILTSKR